MLGDARPLAGLVLVLFSLSAFAGEGAGGTDMTGRQVAVPERPTRIVSLLPAITETLFAIGAGQLVVGRTSYCRYPPGVLEIPVVGDIANPVTEAVLRQRPDLILASDFGVNAGPLESLESLGLPVHLLDFRSYPSSLEAMTRIGRIAGAESKTAELLKGIRAAEQEVRHRVEGLGRPRVLVTIMHGPVWVAGKETFLHHLLTVAGGINVVTRPGYGPMETEAILLAAPDLVLVAEHPASLESAMDAWQAPEFSELPALRKSRVLALDARVTVPGPRMRQAFFDVLKAVHPEILP